MTRSKRVLYGFIAAVFWLAVWEIAAHLVDNAIALPTVEATAKTLGRLIGEEGFWQTVGASIGRILLGLAEGTLLGAVLALLTVNSQLLRAIISPAQTVIRSVPVASFILVLWMLLKRDAVPTAIALLMVMPVVWQSLCDGYDQLDPALNDVVRVFHASFWQRLVMFVIPSLRRPFFTALATALGLAWKAGVAAEIIAYTKNSIGFKIVDARNYYRGEEVMAWTVCVVVLSLLMEALLRLSLRRSGVRGADE